MARPVPTFHGFSGQRETVETVIEHCTGAKSQSVPLPHTLLCGPSGIGKTAFARAAAEEMGTGIVSLYCTESTRRSSLAGKLASLNTGDILFLDEVHALAPDCQELLYPAIDELTAPKVSPDTGRLTGEMVALKPFTLILASDQCGRLRNALKRRIPLQFTFSEYDIGEMRVIVGNYAAKLNILLKDQAVTRLAEAARGLPRKARHLMESLKMCAKDPSADIAKPDIVRQLRMLGIDGDNLDNNDRRYLAFLARRGGHVSLQNMGSALGLDLPMIVRDIEGYLIRRGLVGIEARGRFLTEIGRGLVMDRGIK